VSKRPDIDALFAEGVPIDRAIQEARRLALLKHKRAGLTVPIWKAGRVKWVKPDRLLNSASRKTVK